MRSALLVLLGVTSVGCTRPNPAFGAGGSTTSGGTGGPTGGSSAGDQGSAEASSVAPDDTAATGGSSSDDGRPGCTPSDWALEPVKDNVLVFGELCSVETACVDSNFGQNEFALLRGYEFGQRGYLLMTFDLGDFEAITMDAAELLLVVEGSMEPFQLHTTAVFPPPQWGEGGGYGGPAVMGESTWAWSAFPDEPWVPDVGEAGDFFALLDDGLSVGVQPYESLPGVEEVSFPIPAVVLVNEIDEQGLLHLAVTNTAGPNYLSVFTRESFELTPLLAFTGC